MALRDRLNLLFEPHPELPSTLPLAILRCIIAEAPDRPDMAKRLHATVRGRAEAIVRGQLDRSVEIGEIAPLDTHRAARILLDMVKHNPVDHLIDPDTIPSIGERRDRMIMALDLFCAGIARP